MGERSTEIYIRDIAHVQYPGANAICKPELLLQEWYNGVLGAYNFTEPGPKWKKLWLKECLHFG